MVADILQLTQNAVHTKDVESHVIVFFSHLVWNAEQRRPRAAVRIMGLFLLWLVAPQFLDQLLIAPLMGIIGMATRVSGLWLEQGLHLFLYLAAVFLVTWAATRFLDRRMLVDLGLRLSRSWWIDLLAGLALGALLMTLVFVAQLLLGWVTVTGVFQLRLARLPFLFGLVGPILLFIGVAIVEELMFRGYLLHNLAEGLNTSRLRAQIAIVLAWIISSLLFGLLHIFNPNSSWASTLNLMLAGVMLGLPTVLTGSLALPMGLHFTWNLFQGNIYGFPVSGNDFTGVTVIAVRQQGPPLWTGGSFGPEAGLLGLCAVALGCVLIVWWVRWRHGEARLWQPLAIYSKPGPQNEGKREYV